VVGVTVCAVLVLFSVFMMRWNVVIGGQEISKTGKGLLSYHLPLFGKEGALVAIALTLAPLVLLFGLTRLFPPWEDQAHLTEAAVR
jgi:predicted membrane protein